MRGFFDRRRRSVLDRQTPVPTSDGRHPRSELGPRRRALGQGARGLVASGSRALGRRALAALVLTGGALAALAGAHAAGWIAPLAARLDHELLDLQSISVTGAGHLSPAEIVAATGLASGTSLLDVSSREVEDRLRAHPWIRDARVMRLPPGRVLVSVVLRKPVARLATEPPALVDEEGRPFALAAPGEWSDLPEIVPAEQLQLGAPSPRLAEAAAAAASLARAGYASKTTTLWVAEPGDPAGVSVRIAALPGRVVLGSGDLDAKLARLSHLLAAGRAPALTAAEIDLRFADRAVLRGLSIPDGMGDSAEAPLGSPPPEDRAG